MYCNLLEIVRKLKSHTEWMLGELESLPLEAHKEKRDLEEFMCESGVIFLIFRYIQLDFSKIYKLLDDKDKSDNLKIFNNYDKEPENFVHLKVMSKDL